MPHRIKPNKNQLTDWHIEDISSMKHFWQPIHHLVVAWRLKLGNQDQGNKPYLKAFPGLTQNSAYLSSAQKKNKNMSSLIRKEKW